MCNLLSANQFFDTLKPGTVRPRLFRGKNPGFAAGRALLTGRFFPSGSPADIPAHIFGEVWPQNGIVHPVNGRVRPPPFGQSPKRRQKGFLIPGTKRAALLREGMFRASRETPTGSAGRRFLFSTVPNQLGESPFLLMHTGYGLRPYPASFGKAETLHPRKAAFYAGMSGCGFPATHLTRRNARYPFSAA